ncbi:F-box protein CPR1-like [Papaver somniferum]|uniref:F-box protein CPR1-like n=1 Tax=Papaver somniferum TaxID=3469 RepID=UPI000E700AAF|nr:F-box protein CPR1-like [Papaver somniferum]
MSSIPEELYHVIIVRLPAKSLLACKFVCRNWFKLISNPEFVKSHLHLSLTTTSGNNNPNICISSGKKIYSTKYDSLLSSASLKEFKDNNAVEMYCPFDSLNHVELLGSCNGVIFLTFRGDEYNGGKGFLCLWNPVTREYKQIPGSPNDCSINEIGMYAFGYDDKIDTYKVFETVEMERTNSPKYNVELETMEWVYTKSYKVNVYTLESNSWKSIQLIPYEFAVNAGVLVDGYPHWLAHAGGRIPFIISLDVSNERFEEMKLPKENPDEGHRGKILGVLEGSLCILSHVRYTCYEVWMMQEYGVQESWTKCHVITHKSVMLGSPLWKMWSIKNGEILLKKAYENLVLYDPWNSSAKDLKIVYLRVLNVENLVESLVSLKSGTFTGSKNNRTNGTKMKRSKKNDRRNHTNPKRLKKNN